jgi:hypothetical protein
VIISESGTMELSPLHDVFVLVIGDCNNTNRTRLREKLFWRMQNVTQFSIHNWISRGKVL